MLEYNSRSKENCFKEAEGLKKMILENWTIDKNAGAELEERGKRLKTQYPDPYFPKEVKEKTVK